MRIVIVFYNRIFVFVLENRVERWIGGVGKVGIVGSQLSVGIECRSESSNRLIRAGEGGLPGEESDRSELRAMLGSIRNGWCVVEPKVGGSTTTERSGGRWR